MLLDQIHQHGAYVHVAPSNVKLGTHVMLTLLRGAATMNVNCDEEWNIPNTTAGEP